MKFPHIEIVGHPGRIEKDQNGLYAHRDCPLIGSGVAARRFMVRADQIISVEPNPLCQRSCFVTVRDPKTQLDTEFTIMAHKSDPYDNIVETLSTYAYIPDYGFV